MNRYSSGILGSVGRLTIRTSAHRRTPLGCCRPTSRRQGQDGARRQEHWSALSDSPDIPRPNLSAQAWPRGTGTQKQSQRSAWTAVPAPVNSNNHSDTTEPGQTRPQLSFAPLWTWTGIQSPSKVREKFGAKGLGRPGARGLGRPGARGLGRPVG